MTHGGKAPTRAGAALTILFIVALFNNIDRALISILQVPIKRDLNLSDAQLGALTGLSFAVVYALASLPIGRMVDRYRRTWLLAGALTLWTVLTAASGFAAGFAVLVVCRLGVALGEAACNPATYSLLSDYYPPRRRGRAFSVFTVAPFVGVLIGVFAGGWLSSGIGWRQSFVYVGLLGLLIVPLLLWLPEPPRGQHEEGGPAAAEPPPPLKKALATLFALPAFRMLMAGMTLQSFVTATYLNWTAPFLSRTYDLPLTQVGLWTALPIGIGGAIGALSSGFCVDVMTKRSPGWYGWASAGASAALVFVGVAQCLAPTAALSIAISFVAGALASFFLAPSFAAAQSMVPASMRGVTTSVLMIIPSILGTGLGPLSTGLMSDYLASAYGLGDGALRYAFAIAYIPALAAAVTFYLLGRGLHEGQRAKI